MALLSSVAFAQSVSYTLADLNDADGLSVLKGDASLLKKGFKVYIDEIDFSNCMVEDKTVDAWLSSLNNDYVNDWPKDKMKFKGYLEDRIGKKCKAIDVVDQKDAADYVMNTYILKMEPGYYTPVGFSSAQRKAAAKLWGIIEFSSNDGPALVLSINNLNGGNTSFTPTMRFQFVFFELGNAIAKMSK